MFEIEFIDKTMKEIDYGYVDVNNIKHNSDYDNFSSLYRLQSPKELLQNKTGVCWDQVELERELFSKLNIHIKSYFIVYYDNDNCPTHTFVTFKDDNKYYWYEHSWEEHRGLHQYSSERELFDDVKNKFLKHSAKENISNITPTNMELFEYKRPKYGISCEEFYQHCEKGRNISI